MNNLCQEKVTSFWVMKILNLYPATMCEDNPYQISTNKYKLKSCYSDMLHEEICGYSKTLYGCNIREQYKIYGDNLPTDMLLELAEYLEEEKECVGFCSPCPHNMYTNCSKGSRVPCCEQSVGEIIKCI